SDEVPHSQRPKQSLDAGLVFLQRTRGTLPQHYCAKCLRENLPKWMGLVQYPVRCVYTKDLTVLATLAICFTFPGNSFRLFWLGFYDV
ncbi:Glutamate-gated chloride channel, partial [Daphnia magna]